MSQDLEQAVLDFFTCAVDLPGAPDTATKGTLWWEDGGDGWLYPWRMTGPQEGYPCGEPKRKES